MDDRGNFAVTWTETEIGGDTNVLARRFNSSGTAVGGVVPVGVGTFREYDPDVAMDAVGNFVVSSTRDTNNNNPDVFAKQYNGSNQLINTYSVAVSTKPEIHSSVAIAPDGRFDVAFESAFSSADHDIKLNRYGASGGLIEMHVLAASTANESLPSVSMDNSGNAVVAWRQDGLGGSDVKAKRVSSAGLVGNLINIAGTTASEGNPSVALKRGGSGFVVAYESTSTVFGMKVAEVSASNAVTTIDVGVRSSAAVSINSAGDYLLTYTSYDANDANIRGRRGHLS